MTPQDYLTATVSFVRTIPFCGMDAEVVYKERVLRSLDGSVAEVRRLPELRRIPVQRTWDVQFVPDGAPQIVLDWQRGSAAATTVQAVNLDTAAHSRPGTIYVNADLPEEQQLHALLHEVGHLLTRQYAEDLGLLGWEAAAEEFALQVLQEWDISPSLREHDINAFEYTFSARGQRQKVDRRAVKKAVTAAVEQFFAAVALLPAQ